MSPWLKPKEMAGTKGKINFVKSYITLTNLKK